MRLPHDFIQSITELLGDESEEFLKSYNCKSENALRVNTSKISTDEFEKRAPFRVDAIPFVSNGYYIEETDRWAKHPYYHAGLYYFQEPSAMFAASVLPTRKGDLVLDICAAPGGKSTALATRDIGLLVSNDISISRTIPLVKNLEHFGTGNYNVTCAEPSKLSAIYRNCFDAILVDAPCSGEGMFRKDKGLISSYEQKGPDHYAPIQKDILENAYMMLKPGGYLLYSTCTFSDIEDEQVIIGLLEKHDDLTVCPIKTGFGLSGPYEKYMGIRKLNGIAHAFPHRFKGEGHFMALVKKEQNSGLNRSESGSSEGIIRFSSLNDEAKSFAGYLSEEYRNRLESMRFLVGNDGHIFILPEGFERIYNKSIRYARTGTCLGVVNASGRFTPHTAFALIIHAHDFTNRVSFGTDDDEVIRYLKGETVIIDKERFADLPDKGYVLVCVEEFPLGFAKYDGDKLKNLYEKGWIYR